MIKGYLKLIVLKEMMQDSLTGYEIMQKLKEATGKKPSSGTIYPMLKELREKGYINQKDGEDSDNKKFYKITAKGRRLVEKLIREREEMIVKRAALLESVRGMLSEKERKVLITFENKRMIKTEKMEFLILKHIMPLKGSIMKAVSSGNDRTRERVMRILDDAKNKIDKITSEGDNK